ncbi:tRNA pseudouridine synthase A [Pseudolycoriella hygida]|uniref:Pseudouridylate synthase 1 homolog n=1 Tax=Pseudolycoriella hygida TaxID=35572 RepID=A0A9Q0RWF3_9DIPT|nr:tRNA pseudouridine synthase A [Pseudolycoriella hygida]
MTDAIKAAIDAKKAAKEQNANKYKPRYNGRVKKRQWEDYESEGHPEKRANFNPEDRVKRRKFCLLLGYSGANYFGMQRNPNMKTIEEELLTVMLKHKWITEEGFKQPQMVHFQRAARTDKGVSAARQCVSMKLPEELDVAALNNDLPAQIQIFCIKRVTKGFNSKDKCDARTYTYTLPTIAFDERSAHLPIETFRLSNERLDQVNAILKMFQGTKNFHNFTSRKDFSDPSSNRFIHSFSCGSPFVDKITNIEFAVIKIKGQSFMLHQIRKMIGLTLTIIRGLADLEYFSRAFTAERLDIPMAPGLGLVLDETHYDKYNQRFSSDGMHEALDWINEQTKVEKFFSEHIFPTIVNTEMTEKSMINWLETLSLHSFDVKAEHTANESVDTVADIAIEKQ